MKTTLFMCTGCKATNMVSRLAINHNTRTGHRYIIQTPEALMTTKMLEPRKLTPEEKAIAIDRVDAWLASEGRLIVPTEKKGAYKKAEVKHPEACRCYKCQKEFIEQMGNNG